MIIIIFGWLRVIQFQLCIASNRFEYYLRRSQLVLYTHEPTDTGSNVHFICIHMCVLPYIHISRVCMRVLEHNIFYLENTNAKRQVIHWIWNWIYTTKMWLYKFYTSHIIRIQANSLHRDTGCSSRTKHVHNQTRRYNTNTLAFGAEGTILMISFAQLCFLKKCTHISKRNSVLHSPIGLHSRH